MKESKVSGKVNLGCLFLIIVLIAGGYVGFEFGKVYLAKYLFNRRLYEMTGDVAADYRTKIYPNNRAVAEEVIREARNSSIDITHDDITIKRDDQLVIINVTWEGDVVIPRYTYHFVFEFEAKRNVVY